MEDVEMEQEERGTTRQITKRQETNPTAFYVTSLQTFETSGYYDASNKRRYPSKEKPTKIVSVGDNRRVEIVPTQKYGYPNAVDLDYQRALFRIIDEQAEWVERINSDSTKTYHPHVQLPVRAQAKPWIRLAGRYPNPRERKHLDDYVHRNQSTSMHGLFEDPKTRKFGKFAVSLFSQVLTRGEQTKDGSEAESYMLWLTDYAMRLYHWNRTRREDITFHNLLTSPIAKVIVPYLDSGWFARCSTSGQAFHTKSYASLCNFLSIPSYKFESQLKGQLDPIHEELKGLGYLDRWEYDRRPNGEWFITWYAGWKWFEDAKVRGYAFASKQLESPKPESNQQPSVNPDAEELARYFSKLFRGIENATPTAKATAQAASLIDQYGKEKARYVVDFCHRVAPESNFKPQFFGAVMAYAPYAIADHDRHKHAEERRKQEQAQQLEKERREAEAAQQEDAILGQLPPEDYTRLYAEAQDELFASQPFYRKNPDGYGTRALIKKAVFLKLNAARSSVS